MDTSKHDPLTEARLREIERNHWNNDAVLALAAEVRRLREAKVLPCVGCGEASVAACEGQKLHDRGPHDAALSWAIDALRALSPPTPSAPVSCCTLLNPADCAASPCPRKDTRQDGRPHLVEVVAASSTPRFEHASVTLNALDGSGVGAIDRYAADGWELVSVTTTPFGPGPLQVAEVAYFKRPIPAGATPP